jgi:hypothetical protein
MIDAIDPAEPIENAEAAEQIENAEAADPIEPIDRTDPADPIDSTEPREPIDRNESSDQSDHRAVSENTRITDSICRYERFHPTLESGSRSQSRQLVFDLRDSGEAAVTVLRGTDAVV